MTQESTLTSAEALKKNYIRRGSKEHIALLEMGYGMSLEKAKQVIKERKENPMLWPYDVYERAESMLAAINIEAAVHNTKPGWKRAHAE